MNPQKSSLKYSKYLLLFIIFALIFISPILNIGNKTDVFASYNEVTNTTRITIVTYDDIERYREDGLILAELMTDKRNLTYNLN